MTQLVATLRHRAPRSLPPRVGGVLGVALVLGLVLALRPGLVEVVLGSLADAYLQVSVFVAATLLLVAWSERALGLDITGWLAPGSPWRLGAAAVLGALPGCGGAVVVVTQYVAGRTTFGALVAVLTATMGDAAFLLLAREPSTGLAMILLGYGTGVIAGFATERLLPDWRSAAAAPEEATVATEPRRDGLRRLWLLLLAPGAALAVLEAFQVDLAVVPGLETAALVIGVAGALLSVLVWMLRAGQGAEGHGAGDPVGDTAMVTVWVIGAFLAFELATAGFGIDVGALLDGAWMALPLLGVLVGFLPGCGPQIVVATFYLSGLLPVSALAANAISNDGDALFPALALAPRAALAASIVTALPALAVGYGLHMALPVP